MKENEICRMTSHGHYQLELKLHYPVSRKEKKQKYKCEIWSFYPSSLAGDKKAYTIDEYYASFSLHSRLTTPHLSLNEILDSGNPLSPLTRMDNLVSRESAFKKDLFKHFRYESRSLLTIVKKILNEDHIDDYQFQNLINKIEELGKKENSESSGELREILEWTKEGLYLFYERWSLENGRKTNIAAIKNKRLVIDSDESTEDKARHRGEEFIYSESLYKKWSQNILFLPRVETKATHRLFQLILGISAAAAMGAALLLSLLSSKWLPQNNLYLILSAILIYSLKDRIKEGTRTIMIAGFPFLYSDRRSRLIDPASGRDCGKVRERVTFPGMEKLPDDILVQRFYKKGRLFESLRPEETVYYRKKITIRNNRFYHFHQRSSGITDVFRFDLQKWFPKMDFQEEKLPFIINGKPETHFIKRNYHFSFIISLKEEEKEKKIYRYRVLANSDGIQTVEKIFSS